MCIRDRDKPDEPLQYVQIQRRLPTQQIYQHSTQTEQKKDKYEMCIRDRPWNNAALLQRIETALELTAAPKEVPEEQTTALNRCV